ncbi:MAG: lamin tail domain-containing protein, partial [Candidatus Cloacimonadaceae bacterium]
MKKMFFLFTLSLLLVGMAWGQGLEDFTNSNASSGYATSSFVGNNDITWSYVESRDENGDANNSGIVGKALMLRQVSDNSAVSSSTIGGGIGDFSVKLYKGFTGGGNRQVELFINGVSKGKSTLFDDFDEHIFAVNGINIAGDITIEIKNITSKQVIVDDISWTAFASSTPMISVIPATLTDFNYEHNSGPSAEQSFVVSGLNLTHDISISAPADYEISEGTAGSFAHTDPIVLTQASGTVESTTIYVRLKAGLDIGDYNDQYITATSTGADDKSVTCSGEVTTPDAPAAPVATAASAITDASFTANWDAVTGATGYYLDVYTKIAGANATDLFISEYVEGNTGNNKYIEIFNGTGNTVDLTAYSLGKQSNGSGDFGTPVALIGTLANGEVYIFAHSSADMYTAAVNQTSGSYPIDFNGNDCVALYNNDVQIDVVGVVNQTADWGKDVTLVRKSTVSSPTTSFSIDDWDSYDANTVSYLGSHTMAGGTSSTYLTGFENKNVDNVLTYNIPGLDPETTYYYVVRAKDLYDQFSGNSNEIEATTLATTSQVVIYDDGTASGATIIEGGAIPGSLLGPDTGQPAVIYTISTTGIHDVLVNRPSSYGVVDWYCWLITPGALLLEGNVNSSNSSYLFENVDFDAKGDVVVILNDNSTLPVELSSFTAVFTANNNVMLTWVTQSETGVLGFYVYRNTDNDLANALQVSPLIDATNTADQKVYVYKDQELNLADTYYYWLMVSDINGSESFHGPIHVKYEGENPEVPEIQAVTELKQIYPNPFNPNTTISYSLAAT